MHVWEALQQRRAYRALAPIKIEDELIQKLAEAASLSASCFNNQPWRFVFIRDPEMLGRLRPAISKGNEWTQTASLIIAVASIKEMDCLLKGREYYLFDCGMAVASLVLRATELGLVAHPIAGFDEKKAKEILWIPENMMLITLVIVGQHATTSNLLSDKQQAAEGQRPERLPLAEFMFIDHFNAKEKE